LFGPAFAAGCPAQKTIAAEPWPAKQAGLIVVIAVCGTPFERPPSSLALPCALFMRRGFPGEATVFPRLYSPNGGLREAPESSRFQKCSRDQGAGRRLRAAGSPKKTTSQI